jgi:endoglucanase
MYDFPCPSNESECLSCFQLVASLFSAPTFGALPAWSPPLSTRGRYIVDAQGNRFKLQAANWHGASGTWNGEGDPAFDINHHAGENSHTLPLGLQYVNITEILDSMEQAGLNAVRLPFSCEMVRDTRAVQDDWVAANPQLRGKTPLEVYDAVVAALTARGFAVILNNHTNKSRWCCGVNDQNERWNESQTDAEWADAWLLMVRRYKDNKRVVGADLYNEVTPVTSSSTSFAQLTLVGSPKYSRRS